MSDSLNSVSRLARAMSAPLNWAPPSRVDSTDTRRLAVKRMRAPHCLVIHAFVCVFIAEHVAWHAQAARGSVPTTRNLERPVLCFSRVVFGAVTSCPGSYECVRGRRAAGRVHSHTRRARECACVASTASMAISNTCADICSTTRCFQVENIGTTFLR